MRATVMYGAGDVRNREAIKVMIGF